MLISFYFSFFFIFGFSRQGFSVALDPVPELALVDQAGLKLTEISLPLIPSAGIKGMHHHHPTFLFFFLFWLAEIIGFKKKHHQA